VPDLHNTYASGLGLCGEPTTSKHQRRQSQRHWNGRIGGGSFSLRMAASTPTCYDEGCERIKNECYSMDWAA